MLHLQSRVGLDEGERLPTVRVGDIDEELESAKVAVADAPSEPQRGLDDRVAQRLWEVWCRRDFHDLLVATLHAALAFTEVRDCPRCVTENLHLDVPRALDQLFDVDLAVAEGCLRLRAGAFVAGLQLVRAGDGTGAAPAAARDRLDHDRPTRTERIEELARLIDADRAVDPAQHGDVCGRCRDAGAGLVAEQFELLDHRADEGDARLRAATRELGVLRQEAVAGVNRLAAGFLRRRDHAIDVQIRRDAAAVERVGLVGHSGVQRLGVVSRVDSDGAQTQIRCRANDPDRDLATVGDEQARETHIDSSAGRPAHYAGIMRYRPACR